MSSDSQLLASGGADKNIRIWGLDFGDCHRSVFAHEDSVTSIAFVPKTHYLFSTGKDRLVKYWDADKFEPLLTLQGHHASAWCVALSTRGEFAVTGGHDRAIRVWERTDEPFFVDELGLGQHLSPTRANGLNAMLAAIKQAAIERLA